MKDAPKNYQLKKADDAGYPRHERDDSVKYRTTFTEVIKNVLPTLPFREREILKLRYGIGTDHNYTLEEVGKVFKVTRERVRQIEARAIRLLQHPVRARKLGNFLEKLKEYDKKT